MAGLYQSPSNKSLNDISGRLGSRGARSSTQKHQRINPLLLWIAIAGVLLLYNFHVPYNYTDSLDHNLLSIEASILASTLASTASAGAAAGKKYTPLPALPLQSTSTMTLRELDQLRIKRYSFGGGQGDPRHLGGFGQFDKASASPAVWQHMVETFNIRTVLDVGCARGWSASWFYYHQVHAVCVEGSHDAIVQNALTDPDFLIEHDFTRGPWGPATTVDAIWAADFVQQVSLQYQANYLETFRKAAMLFITTPQDGGWHTVELHTIRWWILRLERMGFHYERELSQQLQQIAANESRKNVPSPDGASYNALSIIKSIMVSTKSSMGILRHNCICPHICSL
jgi:hypothetical protein